MKINLNLFCFMTIRSTNVLESVNEFKTGNSKAFLGKYFAS